MRCGSAVRSRCRRAGGGSLGKAWEKRVWMTQRGFLNAMFFYDKIDHEQSRRGDLEADENKEREIGWINGRSYWG